MVIGGAEPVKQLVDMTALGLALHGVALEYMVVEQRLYLVSPGLNAQEANIFSDLYFV